ncbi:MAG: hypothetical protein GY723_09740 [bacterium]|nr:hypothetical protein [bacterium]
MKLGDRIVFCLVIPLLCVGAAGPARMNLPDVSTKTPLAGGSNRPVIVTIPFVDERSHPQRCGIRKGFKAGGDVVCKEREPSEWIATELAEELSRVGFQVPPESSGPSLHTLRIEGTLERFVVEPLIGWVNRMECDLQVSLVATTGSGLRAERTFFSKRRTPANTLISGLYTLTAAKSAGRLLSDMVRAIIELSDRNFMVGEAPP